MARKKKAKWPYKFLTEEKMEEYKNMEEQEVVDLLKTKSAGLEKKKREKKNSEALKDLRADIKEHRDSWDRNDEIEDLQDQIKALKEERDDEIYEQLEDKKSLEGGMSDQVKGYEEHVQALLYVLRFHHKK